MTVLDLVRAVGASTAPGRQGFWLRRAVMLVAHENGVSYKQIGRRLNRDHTTVMDGVAKARERVQVDQVFATLVEGLRRA